MNEWLKIVNILPKSKMLFQSPGVFLSRRPTFDTRANELCQALLLSSKGVNWIIMPRLQTFQEIKLRRWRFHFLLKKLRARISSQKLAEKTKQAFKAGQLYLLFCRVHRWNNWSGNSLLLLSLLSTSVTSSLQLSSAGQPSLNAGEKKKSFWPSLKTGKFPRFAQLNLGYVLQ